MFDVSMFCNIIMERKHKYVLQDYCLRSVWNKSSPNICHKLLQWVLHVSACLIIHVLLPHISPSLVSECLCRFVIVNIRLSDPPSAPGIVLGFISILTMIKWLRWMKDWMNGIVLIVCFKRQQLCKLARRSSEGCLVYILWYVF